MAAANGPNTKAKYVLQSRLIEGAFEEVFLVKLNRAQADGWEVQGGISNSNTYCVLVSKKVRTVVDEYEYVTKQGTPIQKGTRL